MYLSQELVRAIIIVIALCLLANLIFNTNSGEYFDGSGKNLCTINPMMYHTKDVGKFVYELKGKNILANVRTFEAIDGSYNIRPGIFRIDVDRMKFIGDDHKRLEFVLSTYDSYYKSNVPSSKLRFTYADGDVSSSLFSLVEENDEYPWAQITNTILNISTDDDDIYELSLNIGGQPIWSAIIDKNNILICE